MKAFALSFFVVALTAAAVHAADAANPDPKAALVRAMRTDEIALGGAKRAFLSGAMTEKYPAIDKKCVKRFSFAEFTAGFSQAVGQVLNPTEIDTALKFYQSEAGVKFVEGTLRRLQARYGEDSGIPKIDGKEDISPQQMAEISEFTRSDLGHKVMGKQLSESPALLLAGREMVEKIGSACSKK